MHIRKLVPISNYKIQIMMFIQVGFDMAPIQIPLKCVDPSIAGRVQWVHGNLYVPCGSFS